MNTVSRRGLRLASGLTLFGYLAAHLTCHALGLVSVEVAERALAATVRLWHSVPGTLALYGAAALHIGLAFEAVYQRRTLRMPPAQALRIVLGVLMPLSLLGHAIATRGAAERLGLAPEYQRVVAELWAADRQGWQLVLLVPGWLHGCMGLAYAFGHRRGWPRLRPALFALALLLPVLSATGFLAMGRELAWRAAAPAPDAAHPPPALSTAGQRATLGAWRGVAVDVYAALLGAVLAARLLRALDERRRGARVRIGYPGRQVAVPRGWTVLEASRAHGIGHRSQCGGRARCTTCRVRVTAGAAHCPPPAAAERAALRRCGSADDVHLACQLRPTGDVSVQPLLAVDQPWWREAPPLPPPTQDRALAVLAVELRPADLAATAHDTVYALEQFQALVESAVAGAGGAIVRHGGERWTAVFGAVAAGPATGAPGSALRGPARDALVAALHLAEQGGALVDRLATELHWRADIGIAVDVGHAVVGHAAAPSAAIRGTAGSPTRLTVVGEGLRGAEALGARALAQGWRLAVSAKAAAAVGVAAEGLDWAGAAEEPPTGRDPGAGPVAVSPVATWRRSLGAAR